MFCSKTAVAKLHTLSIRNGFSLLIGVFFSSVVPAQDQAKQQSPKLPLEQRRIIVEMLKDCNGKQAHSSEEEYCEIATHQARQVVNDQIASNRQQITAQIEQMRRIHQQQYSRF